MKIDEFRQNFQDSEIFKIKETLEKEYRAESKSLYKDIHKLRQRVNV